MGAQPWQPVLSTVGWRTAGPGGGGGARVCTLPVQNADTAKQLTVTQQSQEEVARVKQQLAFQMEQVKRESEMKVWPQLWRPFP